MEYSKAGTLPAALQGSEDRESAQIILPGGAIRSEKAPSYHLVPRAGLARRAARYQLGADKYGEENWRTGLGTEEDASVFCREAYNHMVEHSFKMVSGVEPEDDHLAAIGWASDVLMEAEEMYGKPWTELGAAAEPAQE